MKTGWSFYDERMVSVKEIDNLKQVGVSATELAIKELGSKQAAELGLKLGKGRIEGVFRRY